MRYIVVAASPEELPPLSFNEDDVVIAVDGGLAKLADVRVPDVVIGDFDSFVGEVPVGALVYPPEKDVTDLELALAYARERGARSIDVYGALGGRLDMTLANIGLLATYPEATLYTLGQELRVFGEGVYDLPRREQHYVSFIPWPEATISITGAKYPLAHRNVTNRETLTVSNEWSEERITLSVHKGLVVAIVVAKA